MKMERQGYVSLWIGNVCSEEYLSEYVELLYKDDGMWEQSQFLKDYDISLDDFDEDFIEKVFAYKKIKSIGELIKGCSYEKIILPRYKEIIIPPLVKNYNSAILLYNFDYKGPKGIVLNDKYAFSFINSVSYTSS